MEDFDDALEDDEAVGLDGDCAWAVAAIIAMQKIVTKVFKVVVFIDSTLCFAKIVLK